MEWNRIIGHYCFLLMGKVGLYFQCKLQPFTSFAEGEQKTAVYVVRCFYYDYLLVSHCCFFFLFCSFLSFLRSLHLDIDIYALEPASKYWDSAWYLVWKFIPPFCTCWASSLWFIIFEILSLALSLLLLLLLLSNHRQSFSLRLQWAIQWLCLNHDSYSATPVRLSIFIHLCFPVQMLLASALLLQLPCELLSDT